MPLDQSKTFKGEDHVVDGRGGDGEEALEICFGRRLAGDAGIGMDEGQVLALFVSEGQGRFLRHSDVEFCADNCTSTLGGGADERTIPGAIE